MEARGVADCDKQVFAHVRQHRRRTFQITKLKYTTAHNHTETLLTLSVIKSHLFFSHIPPHRIPSKASNPVVSHLFHFVAAALLTSVAVAVGVGASVAVAVGAGASVAVAVSVGASVAVAVGVGASVAIAVGVASVIIAVHHTEIVVVAIAIGVGPIPAVDDDLPAQRHALYHRWHTPPAERRAQTQFLQRVPPGGLAEERCVFRPRIMDRQKRRGIINGRVMVALQRP